MRGRGFARGGAVCAAAAVLLLARPPMVPADDAVVHVNDEGPGVVTIVPIAHEDAVQPIPVPPTDRIVVRVAPGADVLRLARDYGLAVAIQSVVDSRKFILLAASAEAALGVEGALRADARVARAYNDRISLDEPTAFVPNDPFYPPFGGGPGQWHLEDMTGLASIDTDPQAGPWNSDITGSGVVCGICDDGVETAHPDLATNYSAANSFNFGSYIGHGAAGNPNPEPVAADSADKHGTSVAGVTAARGGNAIGVTGAAPFAKIAALRRCFGHSTIAMTEDLETFRSSGAITDIKIKNHSYGFAAAYVTNSAVANRNTSSNAGTIHCQSAGNDRGGYGGDGEDANSKDQQNEAHTICVAALSSNKIFSDYSNYGANVACTAPSSSFRAGEQSIITTDRTGAEGYNTIAGGGDGDSFADLNYTSTFGGTSSSSPLVAGIAALLRQQIGAGFTHRTFKHLLARRAEKIDLADATPESGGGWKTNAAGFSHNQNYGWGNCNAYRLWQLGRETAGVTADTITSSSLQVENAAIPDLGSITRTIALFTAGKMEEFELTCEFNSADWGDIEIEVTSPAGTTSRLIRGQSGVNGSGTLVWKYMSLQFWGESGVGTWTLKFKDVVAGDLTTLVDWQTTRHIGDFVPTVPRKPTSLANTGFNSLGKPNLKWSSDSLVETGFHIYRKKTTDLVYVLVGTNAANDVTFTDKAAAGKTAYNYYVKAFNDQGEGGKSNTITVITP